MMKLRQLFLIVLAVGAAVLVHDDSSQRGRQDDRLDCR